ncbi:hypothetical protein BSQ39_00890 [Loigolactobacillus backii]|uniref:acyltransferase family protein n=1 Tax=Loigolactobacillus backii TaxID=375175 RepID=UPI000C1CA3F0|nr:acyltransferase family protein [Loigolactobacillus backii]PIO82215.1 hypothetical protein BSQ39_00890 [Loigolactobacillus backii]
MRRRIDWIDIAKALGIIAVVIGHAAPVHGTFFKVLYWWHMPLFFIMAGFFLKPVAKKDYLNFLKEKLLPLYLQYLFVGFVLTLTNAVMEQMSVNNFLQAIGDLFYGGTLLNGTLSAFWYMTVYLLAVAAAVAIISFIKTGWQQWLLVIIIFVIGVTYKNAQAVFCFPLPGDADVALCALLYTYVGYRGFRLLKRRISNRPLLIGVATLASGLIIAQQQGIFDFKFYLKSHTITEKWLTIAVPLVFCLLIFMFAYWLQYTPALHLFLLIGRHTLTIMYAHKLVFAILEQIHINGWLILSFAGIIIPIALMFVGRRVKALGRRLFLVPHSI